MTFVSCVTLSLSSFEFQPLACVVALSSSLVIVTELWFPMQGLKLITVSSGCFS